MTDSELTTIFFSELGVAFFIALFIIVVIVMLSEDN